MERVKNDPIRYAKYLKRRNEGAKKYRERLKNDPIRYESYIKNREQYRRNKGYKKRIKWSNEEMKCTRYKRYGKRKPFWKLAKAANHWCKMGKVKSFDLWCLAKKQKLICALTGDRLTAENVSLDHIIPQSKGGTNDITNLQLVTKRANIIKNDMSMNEVYLCCKKIVGHLKGEEIQF